MGEFWIGVLSTVVAAAILAVGRALVISNRPIITYDYTVITGAIPQEYKDRLRKPPGDEDDEGFSGLLNRWMCAERFVLRNRGLTHLKDVKLSCDTSWSSPWPLKAVRASTIDAATVVFEREGGRLFIRIPDFPRGEKITLETVYPSMYEPYPSSSRLKGGSSEYLLKGASEFSSRRFYMILGGLWVVFSAAAFAFAFQSGLEKDGQAKLTKEPTSASASSTNLPHTSASK